MNIFEKSNQVAELRAEWFNFQNNYYPEFVTSPDNCLVPEDIPIFSFHNVSNEDILQKLNYLAVNKYSTICADEYLYLKGKCRGERLVMLTFDDGLRSLSTVAFPMLRAYKMKAVAFVLPGEIEHQESKIGVPGWTDAERTLCSWPELEEMKDVIDIQSHSLYHWLIFTSPVVSCFFTPQIRKKWQRIDWPIPRKDGVDDIERDFKYGHPIYNTDSRLSENDRVYENAGVTNECVAFVKNNGGEEFFKSRGWFNKLMKVHNEAQLNLSYERETPDDKKSNIQKCFIESKRLLDSKLKKEVRHFCFPFGIGCLKAEEIAFEAGYHAVYYGVRPNYVPPKPESARIMRIKDDYIFRLPGIGRKSLKKIFFEKTIRRLSSLIFNK